MNEEQAQNIKEIVFSWECEGFKFTQEEVQNMKDVCAGKKNYKDILASYIALGKAYGTV